MIKCSASWDCSDVCVLPMKVGSGLSEIVSYQKNICVSKMDAHSRATDSLGSIKIGHQVVHFSFISSFL